MKTTKQWTDTYGVSFEQTETGVILCGVDKDSPFRGTSLQDYEIPEGVTEIGEHAFEGCNGLSSILIPSSVTKIGSCAFCGCEFLLSTINVVPEEFQKNEELSAHYSLSFIIPKSVKEIGDWAFKGCKVLNSVIIYPPTYRIGEHAFESCTALKSVTFVVSGFPIENYGLQIEDYAFYNCSLKKVVLPSKSTKIKEHSFDKNVAVTQEWKDTDNVFFVQDEKGITLVKAPFSLEFDEYGGIPFDESIDEYEIPEGVTRIEYDAFRNCENLTKVVIPDSVKEIGEYAFSGCISLSSISIPHLVTEIKECVFGNCEALENVIIPNSVKTIACYAFCDCKALSSVTIPESVKEIGEKAFWGCNLKSVTLPKTTEIEEDSFDEGVEIIRV